MSIFGDDCIEDLLNGNLDNLDQLPDDFQDNEQIFGGSEPTDNIGKQDLPVKVQPKKRNVLNPRPRLNVEVLRGPRGLHTIEDYFKDIKFKGKGGEAEDLDEVIRRLQHWAHRMYPTYKFDDVLTNIERLGKKKPLQVHMSRYRLGMLESMNIQGEINDEDENAQQAANAEEPYDEFDALLDEQIAISKIDHRTPGSSRSRHSSTSSKFATPSFSRDIAAVSTPCTVVGNLHDTSDLAIPLPPSQPTTPALKQQLSEEQMTRIAENKRLALERLAKRKRLQEEAQKTPEVVKI